MLRFHLTAGTVLSNRVAASNDALKVMQKTTKREYILLRGWVMGNLKLELG